jgi:hypothetical protein
MVFEGGPATATLAGMDRVAECDGTGLAFTAVDAAALHGVTGPEVNALLWHIDPNSCV